MEILDKLMTEGILPYDVGSQLKTEFNTKVEAQAFELAESYKAEIETKYENLAEEYTSQVKDEYAALYEAKAQEMNEKVSEYLDMVVENFLKENTEKMNSIIVEKKNDALLEAFQALIIAGGVELAQIKEELDEENEEKLAEARQEKTEKDRLADEVIALRKEIEAREKARICEGLMSGLSDLQKEKMIEFGEKIDESSDVESFKFQLTTFKDGLNEAAEKIEENKNFLQGIQHKPLEKSELLFKSSLFK